MHGSLVTKVEPVHPTMDKVNIEGPVMLAIVIGKDGTVQSAKVVNTPSPMLNGAALDAVKQWRYKPYLLNGTPIEVSTTATVNFTLPKK
jgi:protein TonB